MPFQERPNRFQRALRTWKNNRIRMSHPGKMRTIRCQRCRHMDPFPGICSLKAQQLKLSLQNLLNLYDSFKMLRICTYADKFR